MSHPPSHAHPSQPSHAHAHSHAHAPPLHGGSPTDVGHRAALSPALPPVSRALTPVFARSATHRLVRIVPLVAILWLLLVWIG